MKNLTTISTVSTFCIVVLLGCGSARPSIADALKAPGDGAVEGDPEISDVLPIPSPILAKREPAPDFVLFDQHGFPFPLAEQQGSWLVLHFYPESDTPDCACDATAFTGHLWRFNELSAHVACVTSAPRDRTVLFAKKYGLQSPLLSDMDLAVASQYGAVSQAAGSRADPLVRTTFVLDPEGRIAARWDDVNSDEHVETILETLAALGAAIDS